MEDLILEFIDIYTPTIRVGTDCSGIEAPIQALRQLKIPFKHVFSSEIDKYCIKSIKANYHPEIIFGDTEGSYPEGDITKRNIDDIPDIDLYVCGFPCQPFSQAGKRKGFEDKRGNVFWSCLEVIEKKLPKYFILENVKAITWHDKENKYDKYGKTWNTIWQNVSGLTKHGYIVKWKILNTKEYGIPQNRERLYIIGSKIDFIWPSTKIMNNLEDYVEYHICPKKEIANFCKKHLNKICDYIFVDISQINRLHKDNKTISCLTTSNRFWNITLGRYMTINEALLFQGFEQFIVVNSKVQTLKQIGNSMSINVLKCIFKESLKF